VRQRIGPFQLEGVLSEGGMGVVYRAVDTRMNRPVVLKLLHVDEESGLRRLQREANAMAQLRHPHVVPLHERGEHEGRPYLVLPLLEGKSLQDRLDTRGPLPVDEAVRLGAQVGSALQAAHAAGLVHRDVKPANVLLDDRGAAQLTDFGLVKKVGPGQSETLSLSVQGRFLGTPGYWPKEQALGQHAEVGPPADVYGLGALLYALLSAQPPRQPGSLLTLLDVFERPVAPVRSLRPEVPAWLDTLLAACLRDDPGARPALDDVLESLAANQLTFEPVREGGSWWNRLGGLVVLCVLAVPLGALAAAAVGVPPDAPRSPTTHEPPRPPVEAPSSSLAEAEAAQAAGDLERAWFLLGEVYDGSPAARALALELVDAPAAEDDPAWTGRSASPHWARLTTLRNLVQARLLRHEVHVEPRTSARGERAAQLLETVRQLAQDEALPQLTDALLLRGLEACWIDRGSRLRRTELPDLEGLTLDAERLPHAAVALSLVRGEPGLPAPALEGFPDRWPLLLAALALGSVRVQPLEPRIAVWAERLAATAPPPDEQRDYALGQQAEVVFSLSLARCDGFTPPPLSVWRQLLRSRPYRAYLAGEAKRARPLSKPLIVLALCEGRLDDPELKQLSRSMRTLTGVAEHALFATLLIERARAEESREAARAALKNAENILQLLVAPSRQRWAARTHLRLLASQLGQDFPSIPADPPAEVSADPWVPWYAAYTGEQSFGAGDQTPGRSRLWLPGE